MDIPLTKTIELRTGYRDMGKNVHKSLTFRAPLADDEIKADAALVKMRVTGSEQERFEGRTNTMSMLALIAQCSVQLGSIPNPQLMHFRSMTRLDVMTVIREFQKFEEDVYGDAAGQDEDGKNPPEASAPKI